MITNSVGIRLLSGVMADIIAARAGIRASPEDDMTRKGQKTLGRIAASAGSEAPPAIVTTALNSDTNSTVTMAIARTILLHVRRYALILQERDNVRVTQRDVAEFVLTEYLDGTRTLILPAESPSLTRQVNTLALNRALVLRLKRYALDLSEQFGRTVSMREIAEAMFNSVLEEAGILAAPNQSVLEETAIPDPPQI